MAAVKYRAVMVARVAVPVLTGRDDEADRALVDQAEKALALAYSSRNRDQIAAARDDHTAAETTLLDARAGLATKAESEVAGKIKTALGKLGDVIDVSVEQVEEAS